jgi:very-short-patch-repair endonuclease
VVRVARAALLWVQIPPATADWPLVVDFVCFEGKLVVELDGDQHGTEQGLLHDIVRTRILEKDGFQVLRFPNHELLKNFDGALEGIARKLGLPS